MTVANINSGSASSAPTVEKLDDKPIHPIFQTRLVDIQDNGKVSAIQGTAFLKRNKVGKYVELVIGETIDHGDIIELYPNSDVKISFADGQVELRSDDKTVWFEFDGDH